MHFIVSWEANMLKTFTRILAPLVLLTALPNTGLASSAKELDADATKALHQLYSENTAAKTLGEKAKAVLVFPNIAKAGFVFGAEGGNGVLRKGNRTAGYYNIAAGSFGLQAGVQKFSYALFFMKDSAVAYLDKSSGWEIGTGPSIVVVDAGAARNISSTTLKSDIYAVVFSQKGLMGGIDLKGSKITKIHPDK